MKILSFITLISVLFSSSLAIAKFHDSYQNPLPLTSEISQESHSLDYIIFKKDKPFCSVGQTPAFDTTGELIPHCDELFENLAVVTEDAPREEYAFLHTAAVCAVGVAAGAIMRSTKALGENNNEELKDGFNFVRNLTAGLVTYPAGIIIKGMPTLFPLAVGASFVSIVVPATICAEIGEAITDYAIIKLKK